MPCNCDVPPVLGPDGEAVLEPVMQPVPQGRILDKLRDIMVGFGFIEVLTYGFIPGNSMQMLQYSMSHWRISHGMVIMPFPQ